MTIEVPPNAGPLSERDICYLLDLFRVINLVEDPVRRQDEFRALMSLFGGDNPQLRAEVLGVLIRQSIS